MSKIRKRGMSLSDLKRKLNSIPPTVALRTAEMTAPAISDRVGADYDSGRTAYGDARPMGKYGPVDLYESGSTREDLRFKATGRVIRAVLSEPYVKYLVGRFRILPSRLPASWRRILENASARAVGGSK